MMNFHYLKFLFATILMLTQAFRHEKHNSRKQDAHRRIDNDKWNDFVQNYREFMNYQELINKSDQFVEDYIVSTRPSKIHRNKSKIKMYEYDHDALRQLYPYMYEPSNTCKGYFPSYVSIQRGVNYTFYKHICGGSLVSEKWILTEESCCDHRRSYRVVAGAFRPFDEDITKVFFSQFVQVSTVKQFLIHQQGACLMELNERVFENEAVQYASLKHDNLKIKCNQKTSFSVLLPERRREAQLRCFYLENLKRCQRDRASFICGSASDAKDSEADAGSPLYCDEFQMGIALPQRIERSEVSFLNVEFFYEWIIGVIRLGIYDIMRQNNNSVMEINMMNSSQNISSSVFVIVIIVNSLLKIVL